MLTHDPGQHDEEQSDHEGFKEVVDLAQQDQVLVQFLAERAQEKQHARHNKE